MSTSGWIRGAAFAVGLSSAACMPPSWGASALLHPSRRALTTPRPASAQDVSFESDGLKLHGWLFRGQGHRRGTVVYLHGSADNRASGVSIAERFLRRGFDALAYDSRAHGESEGDSCTYGYYEKRDLSRAIDSVPVQPVVAIGVSLGGAVALQAAAEDRRIVGVVAVATFSDLRAVVADRAPFIASAGDIEAAFRLAEQQAHFKVDEVSPLRAAVRVRVPVLLVHGDADRETPPVHSERVFEALREPKRPSWFPALATTTCCGPASGIRSMAGWTWSCKTVSGSARGRGRQRGAAARRIAPVLGARRPGERRRVRLV